MADFAVGITIKAFDQASGTVRAVDGAVSGLERRLRTANQVYEQQWSRTAQAARTMGYAVGGASAAALYGMKQATDEAARFESVMMDVGIQSQATAANLRSMRTVALSEEFIDLGMSGNEVADALRRIASEGLSVADMQASLKPIAETAVALDYDPAETTKLMLNLMAQYKREASDMPEIADAMTLGLMRTSFQGSELAEAMKMAGVAGSMMGWTLEETIATVDRVAKTTGEASMAGRYLRAVLMELKGPSDQLKNALAGVGISSQELAAAITDPIATIELLTKAHERGMNFAEGFSNVSVAAAGALIGEAASVRAVEQSLHGAGAAHEAAAQKMTTTEGQAKQLAAQWANLKLEVGNALIPVLRELANAAEPVVDVLAWLLKSDLGKPFVVGAAGAAVLGAALTPVLIGLSSIIQTYVLLTTSATTAAGAETAAGVAGARAGATIKTATTTAAVGWAQVTVAARAASVAQLGAGNAAGSGARVINMALDGATGRYRALGDGVDALVPAGARAQTALVGAAQEAGGAAKEAGGAVKGIGTAAAGAAVTASGVGVALAMAAAFAYGIKKNLDDSADAATRLKDNLSQIRPEHGGTMGRPAEPVTQEGTRIAQAERARDAMKTRIDEIRAEQAAIAEINRAVIPVFGINEERLEMAGGIGDYRRRLQRFEELEQERRDLLAGIKVANQELTGMRRNANTAGEAVGFGLADGVRGSTSTVSGAMRGMTDEAGRYLPHSDAEKGAFSTLSASGAAIPATIAQGIKANSAEISDALNEATAQAMADLQARLDSGEFAIDVSGAVGSAGAAQPAPTATAKPTVTHAAKPAPTETWQDRLKAMQETAAAVEADRRARLGAMRDRYLPGYKGPLSEVPKLAMATGGTGLPVMPGSDMLPWIAQLADRDKQAMPGQAQQGRRNLLPGEQWTRYADGREGITQPTRAQAAGVRPITPVVAAPMDSDAGAGMTYRQIDFAMQSKLLETLRELPRPVSMYGVSAPAPQAPRVAGTDSFAGYGRRGQGEAAPGAPVQVFNFNAPIYGRDGIEQVAEEVVGRAARHGAYAR
jgi:TP901 family phage tail tape measure protein